jgi:hypothetical protein
MKKAFPYSLEIKPKRSISVDVFFFPFTITLPVSLLNRFHIADKCERDAFVFNCFTGTHHRDNTDKAFGIENDQDAIFSKRYCRKTKKEPMGKRPQPALPVLNKG